LRSPGTAANPDLDAAYSTLEDRSSSVRFPTTPLRHEDVEVALEHELGYSSGRRASMNPTQILAMPSVGSVKVASSYVIWPALPRFWSSFNPQISDVICHSDEPRLTTPHSAMLTRRSSVSAVSFGTPRFIKFFLIYRNSHLVY
jgi:hypothetical protein